MFHQALHTAYRVFANQHPEWTQRGFDASFLHEDAAALHTRGPAPWKEGECGALHVRRERGVEMQPQVRTFAWQAG